MKIDKQEVVKELIASTAAGRCSDKLARFMLEIAQNSAGYTCREHAYCHDEAVSDAAYRMLKAFVEGRIRADRTPYSYLVCISHNAVRNVMRKNRLYYRLHVVTDPHEIEHDEADPPVD